MRNLIFICPRTKNLSLGKMRPIANKAVCKFSVFECDIVKKWSKNMAFVEEGKISFDRMWEAWYRREYLVRKHKICLKRGRDINQLNLKPCDIGDNGVKNTKYSWRMSISSPIVIKWQHIMEKINMKVWWVGFLSL